MQKVCAQIIPNITSLIYIIIVKVNYKQHRELGSKLEDLMTLLPYKALTIK
jgi:hypothetical protein